MKRGQRKTTSTAVVGPIILETLCDKCQGTGFIQSPAWDDWKPGMPQPDEPEETVCDKCEGVGRLPTKEGRALLGFVKRYYDLEGWK